MEYHNQSQGSDFDRSLAEMDRFRRQMEHLFDVLESPSRRQPQSYLGWSSVPEATLTDEGTALHLTADVPGLAADDLDLQVTSSGLTISGLREVTVPDGYQAHRRERREYRFSRAFQLPAEVDADKVTAQVDNGVLTVRLPKVPEVRPRRITVKA
jgi:HSP20 family protein